MPVVPGQKRAAGSSASSSATPDRVTVALSHFVSAAGKPLEGKNAGLKVSKVPLLKILECES